MTDHEATAKRLLPCVSMCHKAFKDSDKIIHMETCPFQYRSAVAAALAEREAERDNWKARFEKMEGFWRELKAERDAIQERHDALWEMDRKIIGDLKAERNGLRIDCDQLRAALSREFVKGLKLARKIVHDHLRNPTVDGWYSAIQAEIDKAGKNDLDADYLQAERDESFFNGLKRAKEVVGQLRPHQWVSVAVDAIQAEIDKAGKP